MDKTRFMYMLASAIASIVFMCAGFAVATATVDTWHDSGARTTEHALRYQLEKYCVPTPIRTFKCGQRWDTCLCDSISISNK